MRAEVSGNAIEVSVPRLDALALTMAVTLTAVLFVVAGWQVTVVALGMSLLGAAALDLLQRSDVTILGR